MEDVAGGRLEPDEFREIAAARQQPDARGLLVVPEVGEAVSWDALRLECDRQVERDDEVPREAHVVHHRLVRRRDVGSGFGATRGIDGDIAQGRPTGLVGHGDDLACGGVALGMRSEAAFERAAEVRASHALQVVVQLDRQLTALDDRDDVAADPGDVGVHRGLTIARPGDRCLAQRCGRVRAHREPAAIPLRAAAAQAHAVHQACAGEPVVEGAVHWADRARADAHEPAFQLVRDAAGGLEVEGGGLAGHRGEVAAEVRDVVGTVRRCGLGGGPAERPRCLQWGRGAIHLKVSCRVACLARATNADASEAQEGQQVGVELVLVGVAQAVRAAAVDLQHRAPDQLGRQQRRAGDRHDLVVVAVHDQRRHVESSSGPR